MAQKDTMQKIEFSPLFFDTLFGLVIFFSLDSFFDIKNVPHFIFYLFSTIIVVHWWLMFKSSDDSFGEEVTDSAADLVFGINKAPVISVTWFILNYLIFIFLTFKYKIINIRIF